MSAGSSATATWPADVIHVNEDGWVLINRGSRHGIVVGQGLLVVGQGVRELRNLFAGESGDRRPTSVACGFAHTPHL